MKNISLLLITSLILFSCNSNVGKILRNEKISSTDEFLVKKKEPLILPPDYTKIPEPGSLNKEKKTTKNNDKIKKILRTQKNELSKNFLLTTSTSCLNWLMTVFVSDCPPRVIARPYMSDPVLW